MGWPLSRGGEGSSRAQSIDCLQKRPHRWSIVEVQIPSRGIDDPIAALVHVAGHVSHFFGSMEMSFVFEQVERYKERKWWVSFSFIQL